MTSKSSFEKLTDSTVLIAAVTATLYFCTQIFQSTKASLLKYPSYMTETDLSTIVEFASQFFLFLLLLTVSGFVVFTLILTVFKVSYKISMAVVLLNFTSALMFLSLPKGSFPATLIFWYTLAINVLFITIMVLVLKKSSISEFNQKIESKKNLYTWLIAMAILCVCVSTRCYAVMNVSKLNEYYVTKNNIIIAGKFKDFLIGKPYDLKSGTLSDSVILIKQNDTVIISKKLISNLNLGKEYYLIPITDASLY